MVAGGERVATVAKNPNMSFWMDIKEGYDRFELSKTPPSWDVCDKKYVFGLTNPDGAPLDAAAACPARGNDPLAAALAAKETADNAQFKIEVAAIDDKAAKAAADQQAAAAELTAEKARGNSIGNFFSGLFGGGSAQGSESAPPATTTVVAPTPLPNPGWV